MGDAVLNTTALFIIRGEQRCETAVPNDTELIIWLGTWATDGIYYH
jgi:hypothetical protein